MNFPYQKLDIASDNFQILEDLATGSWHSEALFAALDLGVFDTLKECPLSCADLAGRLECDCDGLERLLTALSAFGLIMEADRKFENSPSAARFLVQGSESFAGDFIDYRRFLSAGRPMPFSRKGQAIS